MAIARPKLTAQGEISIPVEVRRKLGVGPGSVLEWDERDDENVDLPLGTFDKTHARLASAQQA